MRTYVPSSPLEVHALHLGEELTVFRIVRSRIENDPVLINSFKSHYEMRKPPRKVEHDSAVLHMGISVFTTRATAAGVANRFPILGEYTARLDLQYGHGLNYAATGPNGHLAL